MFLSIVCQAFSYLHLLNSAKIRIISIGELAPTKYRGRVVAFNNMSVTVGQLLASAQGAGFAQVQDEDWRATLGHRIRPSSYSSWTSGVLPRVTEATCFSWQLRSSKICASSNLPHVDRGTTPSQDHVNPAVTQLGLPSPLRTLSF